jgi:hypothetical protein
MLVNLMMGTLIGMALFYTLEEPLIEFASGPDSPSLK